MTDESPLSQAQAAFAEKLPFQSLDTETCSLQASLGYIAAADINAPMASPPYSRAIVEGFLVNTAETRGADENSPVTFSINGEINPGDETSQTPQNGQGIQVATGSIIADGELSIVRMWEVKQDGDKFSISRPFPPRFFIEEKGCDIAEASMIVAAGTQITAEHIGTLASMGINEVTVMKKPVVTVFASGDEVLAHTDSFKPGYIYDCNTPMLSAAVNAEGGEAIAGGIQSDDFDAFVATVKTALNNSDMIVISGGTAVGGRDFISDLLREVGELVVDGVPMRSGRPLIMGVADGKPIICVAGHPPEAMRGFKLFGVLAMNYLSGKSKTLPVDTVQQNQ